MKPSFAVIGCGKVGKAFGKHLAGAGYRPKGFAGGRMQSVKEAADICGVGDRWFKQTWDASRNADIVLITTPDDQISNACRIIAENKGFQKNAVILHCSGALSCEELISAKNCKAKIGSMHPLQSFAVEKSGNPFENIIMAVEGDSEAVETAVQIAKDLGARPFTIQTDGKILYHAAAVVSSNYLVTLLGAAIRLMEASGVSREDAFEILSPLIQGTLANIKTTGVPDALTGPIARGDVGIVEKHVQAIKALPADELQDMTEYYIRNGLATIKVARAKGTLSEERASALMRIFKAASS